MRFVDFPPENKGKVNKGGLIYYPKFIFTIGLYRKPGRMLI